MIDCIKLKETIKMEKIEKLKMEKKSKINKRQQKVLYFLKLIII